VYFFNAEDLQYINQSRYENIYVVAPVMSETKNPWYFGLLKELPVDSQIINNNFLEPPEKKWAMAQNVETQTLTAVWKVK
jgi:hypothetical protein